MRRIRFELSVDLDALHIQTETFRPPAAAPGREYWTGWGRISYGSKHLMKITIVCSGLVLSLFAVACKDTSSQGAPGTATSSTTAPITATATPTAATSAAAPAAKPSAEEAALRTKITGKWRQLKEASEDKEKPLAKQTRLTLNADGTYVRVYTAAPEETGTWTLSEAKADQATIVLSRRFKDGNLRPTDPQMLMLQPDGSMQLRNKMNPKLGGDYKHES